MKAALHIFAAALVSAFASDVARAQNLLANGGLEMEDLAGADAVPPGWSLAEGGTPPHPGNLSTAEPSDFIHLIHEGLWQMWFQPWQASFYNDGGFAHLTQTVPATAGLEYTMSGWSLFETHYAGGVDNLNQPGTDSSNPTDGPPSPTDSYFALEFLDAGQNVLTDSVEIELRADGQMNDTTWRQHTLIATAPAGTVSIRVRASMTGGIWNQNADPQSYFVDDFILTASAPNLTADFDDDDDVDGNDLLIWQRGIRTSGATPAQGDADGNGAVNGLDLIVWQEQFGSVLAAPVGAAVPEPTAACLASFVLALAGRRRRRA